ncbi:hypothetical protein C8R41DRAFT_773276, partial [Lentinula lateritia]
LDTSAFIPFSQGPANCVGKRLAMFELRYVLVLLFSRYEFSFLAGWDAANWERGLKDQFVLAKDVLRVTLTRRTSQTSS